MSRFNKLYESVVNESDEGKSMEETLGKLNEDNSPTSMDRIKELRAGKLNESDEGKSMEEVLGKLNENDTPEELEEAIKWPWGAEAKEEKLVKKCIAEWSRDAKISKNRFGEWDVENGDLRLDPKFVPELIKDGKLAVSFGKVFGNVSIECNHKLTSFKGCPKFVKGNLLVMRYKTSSLEGLPKEVEGEVEFYHNVTDITEEEIRKYCKVKGKVIINTVAPFIGGLPTGSGLGGGNLSPEEKKRRAETTKRGDVDAYFKAHPDEGFKGQK